MIATGTPQLSLSAAPTPPLGFDSRIPTYSHTKAALDLAKLLSSHDPTVWRFQPYRRHVDIRRDQRLRKGKIWRLTDSRSRLGSQGPWRVRRSTGS